MIELELGGSRRARVWLGGSRCDDVAVRVSSSWSAQRLAARRLWTVPFPAKIWIMSILQFESVSPPLDQPALGGAALRTLGRAEAMGLLHGEPPIRQLDTRVLERVLRRVIRRSGIGRDAAIEISRPHPSADQFERVLRRVFDELGQSPVPATEWRSVLDRLSPDLVTKLVGVSPASVRRYAGGARPTPDAVAERLHFLALVTADLAGSYNDFGIRRWFERPRPQLDMRSPAQLLRGEWHADNEGPQRVRELARALTGPLGT